jgi:hypothetical protein
MIIADDYNLAQTEALKLCNTVSTLPHCVQPQLLKSTNYCLLLSSINELLLSYPLGWKPG